MALVPSVFMFFVMLVSGGIGGNDLLDYVPSDAYWKTKGVTVSVQSMLAELKPAGAAADASATIAELGSADFEKREAATAKLRAMGVAVIPQIKAAAEKTADEEIRSRSKQLVAELTGAVKAADVRRLMAIRTLGELGKPEALETLKGLLASKELFVADYAQAAIAKIEGKPYVRPTPSADERWADAWLMPKGVASVGQVALPPGGPVDLDKLFKAAAEKAGPNDASMDFDKVKPKVVAEIIKSVERTGNIRIHNVTFCVAEDVGNNSGYVGLMVRGVYDPAAVRELFASMGGAAEKTDGVDVIKFRGGDHGLVMLPSSERFVCVLGANQETVDGFAKDTLAAIKAGKGGLAANAEMAALLKPVKVTDQAWAVVRMTDSYRQAPVFAGLDTASLSARIVEGGLEVTVVGAGKDAEKFKASVEVFTKGRDEAVAEIKRLAAQMPALKSAQELLENIKVDAKANDVTVRTTFKNDASGPLMMLPMLLFGRGM